MKLRFAVFISPYLISVCVLTYSVKCSSRLKLLPKCFRIFSNYLIKFQYLLIIELALNLTSSLVETILGLAVLSKVHLFLLQDGPLHLRYFV